MNNDTRVEQGWLEGLLSPFEEENVGIVGSRLLFEDDTIQHEGIVLPLWLFPHNNHRVIPANSQPKETMREVFAVTGACLMIKKRLFNELGSFDENYSWCLEDVDLCMAAKKHGYKVLCVKHNKINHFESQTPIPENIQDKVMVSFIYYTQKWGYYFNPEVELKLSEYRKRNISRFIIFGTGLAGKLLYGLLTKYNFDIVGFMDSDMKKWGDKFLGKQIYSPEDLFHVSHDVILIASRYIYKVREFLQDRGILEKIEEPILEE